MKRRAIFHYVLVGFAAYGIGCALTFVSAERAISTMLRERYVGGYMGSTQPLKIDVTVQWCPAPFIVRAHWSVTQEPFLAGGEEAWCFVTPFSAHTMITVAGAWRA